MKVKKMNNFSEKILKPFATNFFILFFFIVLFELIFGYWFDKDNLGNKVIAQMVVSNKGALTNE